MKSISSFRQGMPYEKVSLLVAIVITVFFTAAMGYNYTRDVNVVVVDLDHSRTSQEVVEMIHSSPHMKVGHVLYTPADPKDFFYEDKAYAVVCLPKDLERDLYSGTSVNIGLYCDYTNIALTADIQAAMNEIAAELNGMNSGSTESGGLVVSTRYLFNPTSSTSNSETEGFLFFFSSMFFTFATIGMVPRLKLEHKGGSLLEKGSPFDLMVRILPYMGCLITALMVGMAILRVWGNMVISGSFLLFMALQIFYIWGVGMMSILFG